MNDIYTERLYLKKVSVDDVNEWYEIFNSDKVGKYLTKYDDISEVLKLINKKINKYKSTKGACFSAILNETNKIIGIVEVKCDETSKNATISYVFNDNYWRNGYATESSIALIEYAFDTLNVNRVLADCRSDNEASINLLTNKLKMTFIETKNIFDSNKNSNFEYNFYELKRKNL